MNIEINRDDNRYNGSFLLRMRRKESIPELWTGATGRGLRADPAGHADSIRLRWQALHGQYDSLLQPHVWASDVAEVAT